MDKPKPLPPKVKAPSQRAKAVANQFSYLSITERAWLAGCMDTIGKIAPQRILNSNREQKFLSYRIIMRSSARVNDTLQHIADMLRLKVRDYSHNARPKMELAIPHAMIDDLIAILEPYLTPETYNTYVRVKYLSELTTFKLTQGGWDYRADALVRGKPARLYKGVNWGQIDKVLKAPELTKTDIKHITVGMERINARIEHDNPRLI